MTTTTTTVRLDEQMRDALGRLTADGTSQSQAIRGAILLAAREARRAEVRRWALAALDDPVEREAVGQAQADIEALRAW